MSSLSRRKVCSQAKEKEIISDSSSSDDELVILSEYKYKPKVVNSQKSQSEHSQKSQARSAKPSRQGSQDSERNKSKSKTTVKEKRISVNQKEEETVLPLVVSPVSPTCDLETVREDTLLMLEQELGRRLDEPVENTNENDEQSIEDVDVRGQVVCPFCWKKLSDKLTGMMHVKSCGKNLPIERIFEAIELHEKQIQEWERIGISYPGFRSKHYSEANDKKTRTKGNRGGAGGAGNSRRRKPAGDPDLELAIALSTSLHEEVIERQTKEANYLADIGLENEVEQKISKSSTTIPPRPDAQITRQPFEETLSQFRVRFTKQTKAKLQKQNNLIVATSNEAQPKRSRSKNPNLKSTKLFTLSDVEKDLIVAERVSQILEQNEWEQDKFRDFHRFNEGGSLSVCASNDRLDACRDKKQELWKMSANMESVPNDLLHNVYHDEKLEDNNYGSLQAQSDQEKENSFKKRSRSMSPALERTILLGDSPYQQAIKIKKHKIDVNENKEVLPNLDELQGNLYSLPSELMEEIRTPPDNDFNNEDSIVAFIPTPTSRFSLAIGNQRNDYTRSVSSMMNSALKFDDTHTVPDPEVISKPFSPCFDNSQPDIPCDNPDDFLFLDQGHDNFDVWENDDVGDSIFAQIPEEILDNNHAYQSSYCASPKLSPILPVSPAQVTKNSRNGKSKDNNNTNIVKAKSRKKGQTGFSSSQPEPEATQLNPINRQSTPPSMIQSQNSHRRNDSSKHHSPLLNYSTIDTPILKQELKKYGLKPLPRSKAKVLLRHIYKETH